MIERSNKQVFLDGIKDGIPICIVYFIVSFTFGITVVNYNMPWWYATLISATNLTSAGQFAGVNLIVASAPYYEIGLTVLFINLRYFLMGVSLSQQLDSSYSTLKRIVMSLFITDEIFALSITRGNKLKFIYFIGLSITPYFGWALGTLTGGLTNSVLPESLQAAMGIALYCMFIALVIPPAKVEKPIILTIALAVGFSCLFYYTPYLNQVSFGFRVIIATILSAGITALIFPIQDQDYGALKDEAKRKEELKEETQKKIEENNAEVKEDRV